MSVVVVIREVGVVGLQMKFRSGSVARSYFGWKIPDEIPVFP